MKPIDKKHIFLRHGQSQFNAGETDNLDSDITKRGAEQIERAAFSIKELIDWEYGKINKLYTLFASPLYRTLKTALSIHQRYEIKVIVDQRIGEAPDEINFLDLSILPNRHDEFPSFDWSRYSTNGMQIHRRTKERYLFDLKSFVEELPNKAVIVSHLNTIKDLTSILVNEKFNGSVPNCDIVVVENGKLI